MKDKPADSSSTASIQHDPKSKDKPKPQQITYPYQNQLKRLLNPTWSALLLSVTALTVAAEFINNPKDFFYPCNYENSISLNDTLKLKSHLNENKV
uniref:Uncharacterized protein n=1 Tax=Panagrolaimus superbus TaxID=310955 RepID=A0A914YIY1_9BILA